MKYINGVRADRNITKMRAVTADTTLDLNTDGGLLLNTTSGAIDVTLPEASTAPSDGIRREYPIVHGSGSNKYRICLSGTDTFVWSNTVFDMGTQFGEMVVAVYNNGSTSMWGIMRSHKIYASAHRDADWDATNFSSMTIVPMDTEAYNNQDELLVYTSGASARYTVKTAGTYKVGFMIDLDSTGGSTWNALAQVYKNGSTVHDIQARTGNYGSEDQSMACIPTAIDLAVDDYIDLRIDQNSLSGKLVHAVLNIDLDI